ncbi:2-succinyl-5-enolpyruvyl-6-hydroxy-3-cyclohexene-1-carboxylic-acid synthase [Acaryochloris sp. CCMEE 5410]|uniref:2-succinyl-5-enolpyruvyl-6-hydroxy-3- cyclohexene-1-carboxylic-acid synthase n=1 Tax=Acaryochloris sp. CCMEE 5410 TaxID=310037 RepID=UPI00030034BB|nr:2-succinyl-5-enolpyruvyl-6-hydroxy-3-cyclohexene-1-carboxylic-acid synthase [Acaryochloris sp. CCMEE 5410]KAI9130923.1 2-succinyl-5-enolpyruvyl-6-hydroxy-3-cyclohexene-1-carboxylic-acid synthase [Acaryochloris sp. CCMEE 5410]
MTLDFRNVNMLWSSIIAETLSRLGLTTAIICPGSRSGPLAVAFAQHPDIEAIPILDERSAAFFGLGIARRKGLPVVLVCTSGTAGANFYPAVIEAEASGVPLLLLTADRPPELRHCQAGQAIDQVKLYGHYPRWQVELALPSTRPEMLAYLRQTCVYAWEQSQRPVPGPVHLNIPFRDPLAPISEVETERLATTFDIDQFFAAVHPLPSVQISLDLQTTNVYLDQWMSCDRGLIIAGPAQPDTPEHYCLAIAQLAQILGWPVLAEGLSPLRNWADRNSYLISTYDLILRNPTIASQLQPEQVISIGALPTSKVLRMWLTQRRPQTWVVDVSNHNMDPLHGLSIPVRISVEGLIASIPAAKKEHCQPLTAYAKSWLNADHSVRTLINRAMQKQSELIESKIAWLLSQILPPRTPLFIANSMPVRDIEYFWQPGTLHIQPYFNRGANGIDGTLSTALGMSHRQQSSVLLTGDLALLHDTNGFLLQYYWQGHLTIIVVNNGGGGIFQMLPISAFDPPFERFFRTPQQVQLKHLAATYQVKWTLIQSWAHLRQALNPLPESGLHILEISCDCQNDTQWRRIFFKECVKSL